MKQVWIASVFFFFFQLATPAKAFDSVRLALNWKPEPQFGGFYAAQSAHLDRQNQIDLELVPGGSGTPVVQMVASGKFDFGIASADEVVISRARGSDVVALFAVFQKNPQGIMVHAESGFKTLADVFQSAGSIAMQKGLPYALYLQKNFAKGLKTEIVPYLGGVSYFMTDARHSQQCFLMSEPLVAEKLGAKVKTFSVSESGFNPYTTVVITRRSVVDQNPALIKRVVETIRSGWRLYLSQPRDANVAMHALNPSLDLDLMGRMAESQRALIEPNLGEMTESRWSELTAQLQTVKLIDKAIEPERDFVKF